MKNETVLKKLYEIKEFEKNNFGFTLHEVDMLIAEIKQEIEREGMSIRSVDIQKAAAKFAKECWKQYHDMRPHIAGAFMYDRSGNGTDMRQGIVDGYVGVSYSKPFEGLMEIDTSVCNAIHFEQIIPRMEAPIAIPNYYQLKQLFKLEKMNKESEKWDQFNKRFVIRLENGQYFSAEYFLRAMELSDCIDGNGTLDGKGGVSPICFRNVVDGNEIECMVLPIRIDIDSIYRNSEYLLADYYKEA